jgi:hypothetical protein
MIGVAFEWILKGKATSAGTLVAQGSLDIEKVSKPDTKIGN